MYLIFLMLCNSTDMYNIDDNYALNLESAIVALFVTW